MAERNYPNDYFAWFNDDQRLAILSLDTTSTDSSERTSEKYDTFQGTGNLSSTITGVTRSSTTATYTTSAAHSLSVNDRVTISGTTDGSTAVTSGNNLFVGLTGGALGANAGTIVIESGECWFARLRGEAMADINCAASAAEDIVYDVFAILDDGGV